MRDLLKLPKAHLHLHFTGSMRHATLLELADRDGIALPDPLVEEWPPTLSAADEKGWFRFQRLYDVARGRAAHRGRRTPAGARGRRGRRPRRRPVAGDPGRPERATAPASAGSPPSPTWCSTRSPTPRQPPVSGMAVVIAANRTRHPLDARTLARLAGQYAGRGVVGFGLSNDERRGSTADFAAAFRDRRAGRPAARARTAASCAARSTSGSASTRSARTGSATASAPPRTRRSWTGSSRRGVALEVCPVSNVALGVYSDLTSVPLPTAARRRRDRRAGRRRPAAVRLAADRPVRHDARRPRARRRPARRAGPDVGARLARARRRPRPRPSRTSTAGSPDLPDRMAA